MGSEDGSDFTGTSLLSTLLRDDPHPVRYLAVHEEK
jgi:hypothetical protein